MDDLGPPRGGRRGQAAGRFRRRSWLALPLACLLLSACGQAVDGAKAAQQKSPPPSVTVAAAERRPITDSTPFTGRVVAVDTVDLRARVTGFLEQRLFKEGQNVSKGDLLLVIEKAPFQAVVEQQQAAVAQAQADLDNANLQLKRAMDLVRNRNIAQSTVDDRQAEAASAKARLMQNQAPPLHAAQINLGYTEIKTPIAGRIGQSIYTVGNLVGPDRGVLATIVSQDPIYVSFPVSSRQLLEARRQATASGLDPNSFVVRAMLPDGSLYPHPGKVDFLDIRVDRGTDTRLVRALFPNPDRLLVDGQFVNVRVEAAQPQQVVVVPQAALQFAQAGTSVLVVGDDNKVQQRQVRTGQMVGPDVVIASGLKPGERVIVEGSQKAKPGQVVAPALAAKAPQA